MSIGVIVPVDVYCNHFPLEGGLSDISFGPIHEDLPSPCLTSNFISGEIRHSLLY